MKRMFVALLVGGMLIAPATAEAVRWNGVKIGPVAAHPRTTHPGGRASIRIAPTRAPAGFVYDVQKRTKGKQWRMYRRGIRTRNVTFRTRRTGRTRFRARVRQPQTGLASPYTRPGLLRVKRVA
ncbi:MAG: hypothetical protein ACJ758_00930 [Actinomycetota bacterium]